MGCGGHARSLIELIESTADWSIGGLVGLPEQVGELVLGYPVIGCDSDLPVLRSQFDEAVLALGQIPDHRPRERLVVQLEQYNFHFPLIVSPHALVSRHAKLSPGTTVGHGVIVNAGAAVGRHCILNTRSLIEHDTSIGDYCHISTGVLVNGDVSIGSGSFIGSGSVIREGIRIPPHSVVGAGKSVMGWPLRNQ